MHAPSHHAVGSGVTDVMSTDEQYSEVPFSSTKVDDLVTATKSELITVPFSSTKVDDLITTTKSELMTEIHNQLTHKPVHDCCLIVGLCSSIFIHKSR